MLCVEKENREKLQPDCGTVYNGCLYYSVNNENGLYELDLESRKNTRILSLPVPCKLIRKYYNAHVYKDKLIFSPGSSDHILIIDVLSKTIIEEKVPEKYQKECNGTVHFRKSILLDDSIWMFSADFYDLIEFNLVDKQYLIHEDVLAPFAKGENSGVKFSYMSHENRMIYIYGKNGGQSCKYDISTESISRWEEGDNVLFGMVERECMYKREEEVEDGQFIFWNPIKIGSKIWFTPFKKRKLYMIDSISKEELDIEIPQCEITSMRQDKEYHALELHYYEGQLIIMPCWNDTIFMYDTKTGDMIRHVFELSESAWFLRELEDKKCIKEEMGITFEQYLKYLSLKE